MSSSLSAQEIASATLQFWDMNAEEAENEHHLSVAVARSLVELGLEKETAAVAAALVRRAMNALAFPDRPVDKTIAEHPLYKAMITELRSGGYDRVGDFE